MGAPANRPSPAIVRLIIVSLFMVGSQFSSDSNGPYPNPNKLMLVLFYKIYVGLDCNLVKFRVNFMKKKDT